MQAKMSEFDGCYFRSRLEVKWAQLFSNIGLRFEYEPEYKKTDLGGYVPDFYFRSLKTWVEIKGEKPTSNELNKIIDVCKNTKCSGFIISSYPKCYPYGVEPHLSGSFCYYITPEGKYVFISIDELYQASKCKSMNLIGDCGKVDGLVKIIFCEYFRYKELKPAKRLFKPKSKKLKENVKNLCEIFKALNQRL